jgi:hypothetical protein
MPRARNPSKETEEALTKMLKITLATYTNAGSLMLEAEDAKVLKDALEILLGPEEMAEALKIHAAPMNPGRIIRGMFDKRGNFHPEEDHNEEVRPGQYM